jgi:hypothetical protein
MGIAMIESALDIIDAINAGSAAEDRAVGCKETNGPSTRDSDSVAGLKVRECHAAPACREDVGDEEIVG